MKNLLAHLITIAGAGLLVAILLGVGGEYGSSSIRVSVGLLAIALVVIGLRGQEPSTGSGPNPLWKG